MKRYLGMKIHSISTKRSSDSLGSKEFAVKVKFEDGSSFIVWLESGYGKIVYDNLIEVNSDHKDELIDYVSAEVANSGDFCCEPMECEFEIGVVSEKVILSFKSTIELECGDKPRGFVVEHRDRVAIGNLYNGIDELFYHGRVGDKS